MVANEHFIILAFLASNTLQTCQILSKLNKIIDPNSIIFLQ